MWPQLARILDERVADAASPPDVTIAGWSLGAGVGQLLALAAQQRLNDTMGSQVSLLQGRRQRKWERQQGAAEEPHPPPTAALAACWVSMEHYQAAHRGWHMPPAPAQPSVLSKPLVRPPELPAHHPSQAPVVDAVLFAAPQVGDDAFVQRFDTVVNARRIGFAGDLVPQVPCASRMPACAASANEFSSKVRSLVLAGPLLPARCGRACSAGREHAGGQAAPAA